MSHHITFCNYLFNYLYHQPSKIVHTHLEDREHGGLFEVLSKRTNWGDGNFLKDFENTLTHTERGSPGLQSGMLN